MGGEGKENPFSEYTSILQPSIEPWLHGNVSTVNDIHNHKQKQFDQIFLSSRMQINAPCSWILGMDNIFLTQY